MRLFLDEFDHERVLTLRAGSVKVGVNHADEPIQFVGSLCQESSLEVRVGSDDERDDGPYDDDSEHYLECLQIRWWTWGAR